MRTATPAGVAPDRERERIYQELAAKDAALARLIARHGHPDPFSWSVLDDVVGGDAFAELALHIVSQQISTPAALTIYGRLRTVLGGAVDPAAVVATPAERLRTVGLSSAKARSLRDLADHVSNGTLSFDALARNDDATAQTMLTVVRGIGPWSAQMLLLHHYRRPDIFPEADIGLLRSARAQEPPGAPDRRQAFV